MTVGASGTAERGRAGGDGVGPPSLVGRDRELRRVTAALSALPALVLVEGEAGIGKSRLVREALVRAAPGGSRHLVAMCPPFREALTLGPVVDAVRQAVAGPAGLGLSALAGALHPVLPEWSDELPPPPPAPADASVARHRLMRALAEVLDRAGIGVMVVEDVHWADEATLDFLVFLATRRPDPVSLVLTYRPEEVPPDSLLLRLSSRPSPDVRHARVALGALTVDDTRRLVSSMLADEHVSTAFAAFLHDRTEGVPLALEECVLLMHDRADLVRRDGEWVRRTLDEIAVPPTIRDAVTERAARLGPAARRVLLAAAVLADPAPAAHLAALAAPAEAPGGPAAGAHPRTPAADDPAANSLAGHAPAAPLSAAAEAVAEAVRSGLLAEDATGRIAFRHILAARAVYDQARPDERRTFHARAAALLEGAHPLPVGRLAHHLRQAGEIGGWSRYAQRAADLAIASGDHDRAATLLLDLIAEPALPAPDVAPLVAKLPLLAFTGDIRRAELLARLRGLLDSGQLAPRDRAEVRGQLGRLLRHLGDYAAAAAELEQAVPEIGEPSFAVAWAMTALGVPVADDLTTADHLHWLERARQMAEESSLPEHDRISLFVDRTTALLDLGEESGWEGAAELMRLAGAEHLPPRVAVQVARGALNLGNAGMRWGRPEQAGPGLAAAVELAGRHGYLRVRDTALLTLVHLDLLGGAWDGLAGRAALWQDAPEEPLFRLDALLVSAKLRIAVDGPDPQVEEDLRHVAAEGERRGIVDLWLEPVAALAALRLAAGDARSALDLTAAPMRLVTVKELWLWATDVAPPRVAALLALGRAAEARALVERFAAAERERRAPAPGAALRVCTALLTEAEHGAEAAARDWQAAADAWEKVPRPYEALRARERAAACLRAAGNRVAAVRETEAVVTGYGALGATHDEQRARRALTGGGRGYGDQLSPRELEVVRLVAEGMTNRQIAQALSRSPKTVATQLNSAMRKRGVTSRTALAVSMTRQRPANDDPADPNRR
ncbi:ATP-binding protein [Streptomyces sp. NPDC020917]|uniref:ATP-binding protein n=1 Tax=Streptomyces sp. NPDC020917 TaxID=3365102 RepID=UPI003796AF46